VLTMILAGQIEERGVVRAIRCKSFVFQSKRTGSPMWSFFSGVGRSWRTEA
jgi:hypothetical protein